MTSRYLTSTPSIFALRPNPLPLPRLPFLGQTAATVLGCAALGLGGVLGCAKARPSLEAAPLATEVAGCAAIIRSSGTLVCRVGGDRKVRILVPAGASEVHVRLGDRAVPVVGAGPLL
jgi:hypothetical protein